MLRHTSSEIVRQQIGEVATALIGTKLQSATKEEYSWLFVFAGDACLRTGSAWRLVGSDRTIVTSEDHGHWFGLPAPVDAAEQITSQLSGLAVSAVSVPDVAGDLLVAFGDAFELQFLQMSSGYESWAVYAGSSKIICYGGGKLD